MWIIGCGVEYCVIHFVSNDRSIPMRLRDSRKIYWPHVTRMASTFHQRTMRELVGIYVCVYFVYVFNFYIVAWRP